MVDSPDGRIRSETKRNGKQASDLSAQGTAVLTKGEQAVVAVGEVRAGLGDTRAACLEPSERLDRWPAPSAKSARNHEGRDLIDLSLRAVESAEDVGVA